MSERDRHRSPYSRTEQLARVLWFLCQATVFRWSPRPMWELRVMLLKLFGAKIGHRVRIHNTSRIFCPWLLTVDDDAAIGDEAIIYNLGPLKIGRRVTISQRAHLCGGTHDYRFPDMPLIRSSIVIEDDAWVCAEAFVGPRATVATGAIVGARAVAIRDVAAWTIVCGNPAQVVKQRSEHLVHPGSEMPS